MHIKIDENASLSSRLYFSKSQTEKASATEVDSAIVLRKPSTKETFGRRLLNAITFGYYTKQVANPREWAAFRIAVSKSDLAKQNLEEVFKTYDTTKRLTRSKASSILADLRSVNPGRRYGQDAPLDASQTMSARYANTRAQRNDKHTNDSIGRLANEVQNIELRLSDAELKWAAVNEKYETQKQSFVSDTFDVVDAKAPVNPYQPIRQDLEALKSILKTGYAIKESALDLGMTALEKEVKTRSAPPFFRHPASFGETRHMLGMRVSCSAYLQAIGKKIADDESVAARAESLGVHRHMRHATRNDGGKAIVAIPLALQGKGMHENHSVLVALDLQKKQVLYLDAKGESPRDAEGNYGNTTGLQQALGNLGKQVFGDQWDAKLNLLMLSNAKQQGANDCIAFTHEFTRRLLDGQSIGEIDRTFSEVDRDGRIATGERDWASRPAGSSDRDGMRAKMVRMILDYTIPIGQLTAIDPSNSADDRDPSESLGQGSSQ